MIGIDLSSQRALVTEASGGLGAGIARQLAEVGAQVVAHYRSDPAGATAAATRTVHADLNRLDLVGSGLVSAFLGLSPTRRRARKHRR